MEVRDTKGLLVSVLTGLSLLSAPSFAAESTVATTVAPHADAVTSTAVANNTTAQDANMPTMTPEMDAKVTNNNIPLSSTAVALPPEDPSTSVDTNYDPYIAFNRPVYRFNDAFDTYFFKPVATFYNKIMPRPLNKGIHNVYNNLGNITNVANDVLQLHWYQGLNDLWRLGINTTVGIGGLFDIAERMDLEPYQNDFGLTMARWGWRNSNYLVFPFLGPSSPRDTIGFITDFYVLSIYPYIQPESLQYQVFALGALDRRAQLVKFENVMEAAALDKYVFLRSAYMQNRAHKIEENLEKGFLTKYRSDISKSSDIE
jgi:phospholipid-binding lipoprotein MlaA